jgi:hypothetical protein
MSARAVGFTSNGFVLGLVRSFKFWGRCKFSGGFMLPSASIPLSLSSRSLASTAICVLLTGRLGYDQRRRYNPCSFIHIVDDDLLLNIFYFCLPVLVILDEDDGWERRMGLGTPVVQVWARLSEVVMPHTRVTLRVCLVCACRTASRRHAGRFASPSPYQRSTLQRLRDPLRS